MEHDLLAGRTIAVVGATGGVGEGLTRALLGSGATVVAVGRDPDRLLTLGGHLRDAGPGTLLTRHLDVSSADSAGVTSALTEQGALDGAVISVGAAARPEGGTVLDISDAAWQGALDGTMTAAFRALRAVGPAVRPDGALVHLLGYSGQIPFPQHPTMGAANAAIRSLVSTLAVQLAPSGPRVHGLVLGMVRTRARQAVGVDDPAWLTGEQVGTAVADLLAGTAADRDALLYLLDPGSGLRATPPEGR